MNAELLFFLKIQAVIVGPPLLIFIVTWFINYLDFKHESKRIDREFEREKRLDEVFGIK